MTLDRGNRQIANATQTGVAKMGYGEGGYGEGKYGGGDQIVIELDDQSTRTLTGVMKNVMAMWHGVLTNMGL